MFGEDLETEVNQAECIQKESKIIGKHVYGNLYGCDANVMSDENSLKNIIIKAAKIAKMTIWDTKVWKFGGEKGGLSALALILESHIAIHTWSQLNYCTVDVFTCGNNSAPDLAFEYIVSKLMPKSITMHTANRSSFQ
jgi:S-adenosylmethionine decarboxylase